MNVMNGTISAQPSSPSQRCIYNFAVAEDEELLSPLLTMLDNEIQKLVLALTPILLVILWRYDWKRGLFARNLPYPPGPKPLPLIGNLYDVPKEALWLGYAKLSKQYGAQSTKRHINYCLSHVNGQAMSCSSMSLDNPRSFSDHCEQRRIFLTSVP